MLVANDVVNSQGITFVSRLVIETGAEAADVVRAYRIARDVTRAPERWESIEALVGTVEPSLLDELMGDVDRLVEVVARWYLQHVPGQLGRAVEAHREPFAAFEEAVAALAPDAWRNRRERAAWQLMDRGIPEDVARRHVMQPFLVHGPDVASVSRATGRSIEDVTRVFFLVGEHAYIDWLDGRVAQVSATTRWHRWALQALEDDLRLVRRQVAERALAHDGDRPPDEAVASYLQARGTSRRGSAGSCGARARGGRRPLGAHGRGPPGPGPGRITAVACSVGAARYARPVSAQPFEPDLQLDERTRAILDFERSWWQEPGRRSDAIRERFGISVTRYHQLLVRAIDLPDALRYDPMLVRRLRRLREARRRRRLARRLGLPS